MSNKTLNTEQGALDLLAKMGKKFKAGRNRVDTQTH